MAMEFTYDRYRELLAEVATSGATFCGYDEPVRAGNVLVRHDVDLSPRRALDMARIESDLGVQATYFFLISTPLYNVHGGQTRSVIRELERLGHDIGLHFSTHQYPWTDDPGEATLADAVASEQEALATVTDPVQTISFHAPPDWVLDRKFEDFRSTYEPRFFGAIDYVADSNQRWREDPPLADSVPDRLQLLTHPGLWGREDRSFSACVSQAVRNRCDRVERYATERYLEPTMSDA